MENAWPVCDETGCGTLSQNTVCPQEPRRRRMELVRAIFFFVIQVGVWLAEEVIDANAASDVKQLLTGLSFT